MARYDVDGGGTTYHPSEIEWIQPERIERQDGTTVRSSYWRVRLRFASQGGEHLPAAFEEWETFDDGALHSIVLPPPNDVLGSDSTYSNVEIAIDRWPVFTSVNVSEFTILIGPVSFTS